MLNLNLSLNFTRNRHKVTGLFRVLKKKLQKSFITSMILVNSSLQCYTVLSDILVKNELCIALERRSNVLSTGEGFISLSPPSKLKIVVLFCSIYKKTISF